MRKAILPLFALGMLSFALLHVARAQRSIPQTEPPVDPARNPYGKGVAGAGIVEPRSENISVGSILPGVVTRILVEVGDDVEAGSPLFQLDKRALQADLAARRAAVAAAQAQLKRLDNQPRKEELPVRPARVREADGN